jgi:oligopeptide transport system substrate-binding protein
VEALVFEWRQNLGVEINVRQLEPERFFYYLKEEKDEMFSIGWIADYPHPQDFLEILFRGGQANNYGEYQNAAVDTLLDKAGVESDNAKSLTMYQQIEKMLVDDAVCIPLWFGKNYFLVKPTVNGYNPTVMGIANLSKVSVSN